MVTFLAVAGAILGALSMVLHVIAPMTASTVDDKIEAAIDEVKALLPGAVPAASK